MGVTPFKKVVAQDVADAMGVAVSTVNKALTGKPGVSARRRLEIQQKAREMGYKADPTAQLLARNPITIGAIMPESADRDIDSYHAGILSGMKEEITELESYKVKSAFYIVSADRAGDAGRLRDWIVDHQVEAVCLNPMTYTRRQELLGCVIDMHIPLFIAGGGMVPPKECISQIEVDATLSGRLAADFVYCWHRTGIRAAVLFDSAMSVNQQVKANAFRDTLENYGAESVEVVPFHNDLAFLREELDRLTGGEKPINSLYVATGFTVHVCRFLQELGRQDQVVVIGTDRHPAIREDFENGTINAVLLQNEQEIGRRTIRMAYDYLVNTRTFGMEDWTAPPHVNIKPQLCLKSYFDEE